MVDIEFPGRKIVFPIAFDYRWNREALERYMSATRSKAVYLPSNIDHLAKNKGLRVGATEVLEQLTGSRWAIRAAFFLLRFPLTSSAAINLMSTQAYMKRVTTRRPLGTFKAIFASVSSFRVERGAKGDADVVRFLDSSLRVVQTVVPCPSTRN